MARSRHDQIAENLAKKFGTEYKKHQGIDIVTKKRVIEVETTKEGIYPGNESDQKITKTQIYGCGWKKIFRTLWRLLKEQG